jgi:hypothetical protein
LYIVLPQVVIASKVEVAIIAGPMRIGILLVLLEGTIVPKPSFAPVTVYSHDCGVLKKRAWDLVWASDGSKELEVAFM